MTYSASGAPLASEIRELVKDSLVFDLDRKSIYAQGREFGYVGLILNGPELQEGERKVFTDASKDAEGNIILDYTNANSSLVSKYSTIEDNAYVEAPNSRITYIYDIFSEGENIYYKEGYLSTRHSTNVGVAKNNGTYVINGVSLSEDGKLSYSYHNLSGNTGTANSSANTSLNNSNNMKVVTGISQSGDGKISYAYSEVSLNPSTLTYHKLKVGANLSDVDEEENYIYVAKRIEVSSPENSEAHTISYSTAYVPTYRGMQEFEKNLNKYNDALRYCGTVTPTSAENGTWSVNYVPPVEPEAGETIVADTKTGAVYKVDSTGYIGTQKVNAGDMIISYNDSAVAGNNNYWNIINENIDLRTVSPTQKYFNNSSSATNKKRILTGVYLTADGTLSYSYYPLSVSNTEVKQTSPNSLVDFSTVNYENRIDLLTNENNTGYPVITAVSLSQDGLDTKLSYAYTYIYTNKNHHSFRSNQGSELTLTTNGNNLITGISLSEDGVLTYQYSSVITSDILWEKGNGDFSLQTVGTDSKALGAYTIAEGGNTYVFGTYSLGEGHNTYVIGKSAHGEGESTYAIGDYSHADGYYSYAYGEASHASGSYAYSIGNYSQSEGYATYAYGKASHSEGHLTYSYGNYAHSEGFGTVTYNIAEHAQGQYNISRTGNVETAYLTISTIGIGTGEEDRRNAIEIMQNGDFYLYGVGEYDGTNILESKSLQQYFEDKEFVISAALNDLNERLLNVNASLNNLPENPWVLGTGAGSAVLKGSGSTASASHSVAEGWYSKASGLYSHAEGQYTNSLNYATHSEGSNTTASRGYSHAEGEYSYAFGVASHVEGGRTYTTKDYSHAEGWYSYAYGTAAHSEGIRTVTYNEGEHASGKYNISRGGDLTTDKLTIFTVGIGTAQNDRKNAFEIMQNGDLYLYGVGNYNGTTINNDTLPIQTYLSNMGLWEPGEGNESIKVKNRNNTAYGNYSVSEGKGTMTYGNSSHAEGENTNAYGPASHAEGIGTFATNNGSHAEGYQTQAGSSIGGLAHAEGCQTQALGQDSHAEGDNTISGAHASHAEGEYTYAFGRASHAEGGSKYTYYLNISGSNVDKRIGAYWNNLGSDNRFSITYGVYSHTEGFNTVTLGAYSHAEGNNNITYGIGSHVEGINNIGDGQASHVEGEANRAGVGSHAEGFMTYAQRGHTEGYATYSYASDGHAEGDNTVVGGSAGHAEGEASKVYSRAGHAEGINSVAYGQGSHSEGTGTLTYNEAEHANGKYNISHHGDLTTDKLSTFSIGIGTSNTNRKNAVTVMQNGDFYLYGIGNYDGSTINANTLTLQTYLTNAGVWQRGVGNLSVQTTGTGATAYGNYSVAEGISSITNSSAIYSHAEGEYTLTKGRAAHAEGQLSYSYGLGSHAEGILTYAVVDGSHTEGYKTIVGTNTKNILPSENIGTDIRGSFGHAEGRLTIANGPVGAHAEGNRTIAYGLASHAEGTITYAYGDGSHSEGCRTIAEGITAHAEGVWTYAAGDHSHAEGYGSYSIGGHTHSEGTYTVAYGSASHSEGTHTYSYGHSSHSEGFFNSSYGFDSHSEGTYTIANANSSHVEGIYTYSYIDAIAAHAEGYYTEVRNTGEHASGRYNISTRLGTTEIVGNETAEELEAIERNKKYNTLFSIGNGLYGDLDGFISEHRRNALEVTENGELYLVGLGDYDGTNTQSAYSLREVIIEDELVTSYALNDLNERISTTNYRIDSIPEQLWKYGTGVQSIEVTENGNNAVGNYSVAAGKDNSAIGNFSFVVGSNNTATGIYSVSAGNSSNANASGTVAIGIGINSSNQNETAFGRYNESVSFRYDVNPYNINLKTIFDIGIGSSVNSRKNALTISDNGEIYIAGIGNYDGTFIKNNVFNYEAKSLQTYLEENERTISEALNDLNTRLISVNDVVMNLPSSIFELGSGNKSIQSPTLLSTANGNYSISVGNNTITNNESETAFGKYNLSNTTNSTFGNAGNTIFSIGAGSGDSNRKNLLEVMQNGSIYLYGIGNYTGTTISGANTLNDVLSGINTRIDTIDDEVVKSISINGDLLNKQIPDNTGNININITGFIGTTALQASSAAQDLTGINKAYISKVIYSGATAVSHDYTHIPSDNEIAITTGDGNGGVSAWIWRENYSSSNFGIFHNNSTNYLHIVGSSTSRLSVNLSNGNIGVGTDSPTQKLHVNGGLLAITNNGNTLTIGSQNSSFLHIYNSANVPFIFNRALTTQGNIYPYATDTYNLGTSTNKWNNLFVNNIKIGTHTISPINTNDINIIGPDDLNYYNWKFNHINLDVTGQVKIATNSDTAPLTVTSSKRVDNLFAQYANEWLPIAEKTYENYTCGSGDNGYIFFMNITPTTSDWVTPYYVKYKLIVNTSNANCKGEYDCYVSFSGSTVTYANFNKFYSGSYRPIYNHYHLYYDNSTKFNSKADHPIKIGARITDAYTPTSLARTYTIKVYEVSNCTVSFPNAIETYTGVYSSTYYATTQPNATSTGLQESGDSTDTTTMQLYYTHLTAGENGLKRYSLCMEDSTGKWQSFTTGTGGIGASKAVNNAAKFKLYSKVYYLNMSGDVAANAVTGNGVVRTYHGTIDYRNSLNLTNSTGLNLVANKPIFIIGTLDTDGYFRLPSTGNWWTQDIPTSEDGKLYIMVSPAAYSWYQSDFINTPNIYWYKNGAFRIYNPDVKSISINPNSNDALNATTLSGNTIDLTSLAGKSYVDTKIAALVNSAPTALDTLNELAAALGNDSNFATTINNSLAGKLSLSGGTMTGNLKFANTTALPADTAPSYFLCVSATTNGITKYTTKANALKALTGLTSTAVGSSTQPIYWDGTKFANSTPTIPGTSNGTASSTSGTITFVESIDFDELNGKYTTVRKSVSVPATQVNANWNETNSSSKAYIQNKPTIPTVNNGTLTIKKNGVATPIATFSANQSGDVTADIQVNELPSSSTLNNGCVLQVVNGVPSWEMPVSIYSGSAAPNNSTGNNGDLYLQI